METKDKKKVTQTLKEGTVRIKVGKFTFRVKPLTLCQIYEMGTIANEIIAPTWTEGQQVNIMQEIVKHSKDAKQMCEIFIVCAFRKNWARKLWGRYIRKHLNINAFNQLVLFVSNSFDANFFLTSITFLVKAKTMTEPTTTPHGL